MLFENITSDQLTEFKEAFDEFDQDKGGTIDSSELVAVFRSLGIEPSDQELRDIMLAADKDGTGSINFTEFIVLMS